MARWIGNIGAVERPRVRLTMAATTLMIMGTSSSVGKSLLAAALCRIYARRGLRVAPFKAQNMSNNAAVCADGAEIGRAQALQARAAGIEPSADMNPVLLKPEGHTRSQVIVLGRPWETLQASRYYERKSALWSVVTAALDRVRAAHELVVIEGAGSPVELNLKASDIVNMAVARYAQSPVVLVGDIDKGGIFAQLLGTLWLLPADERALVRGLIVNKFRGDPALFTDGLRILEERGDAPVLGVVPFLADLGIPEEDAVALDGVSEPERQREESADPSLALGLGNACKGVDIAVIRLPHIANFDDFDPLKSEPGVRMRYVQTAAMLGHPHAIIVPGTKTTMSDLAWMRGCGLDQAIVRLAAHGVAVVGVCGGFQMLGQMIRDPAGAESAVEVMPGLGLLPVDTTFASAKITRQVSAQVIDVPAQSASDGDPHVVCPVASAPGWWRAIRGVKLAGYEIHMGRSSGGQAWLAIDGATHTDGAISPDGRIWGCYLHGLFANDAFRRAWLDSLQRGHAAGPSYNLDAALDRLADAVEAALDMKRLQEIIESPSRGITHGQ
jgi:adenosylcobyric acid synthase